MQAATYVVRPQDTLYSIAWRHDLDFKDLARWNNIGPDYRIEVGQVLQLQPGSPHRPRVAPRRSPRRVSRDAAAAYAQRPPRAAHRARCATAARGRVAAAREPAGEPDRLGAARGAVLQWVWPTDRSAAPKPVPGGGILVLGQLGQSVRAACSGRVVYTGSGIRGYGNLIIIKHGENLLSAYAHTNELLVREGQNVAGGQTIAHMGTGPHQIAALYFEIRLNGKPVDPLPYLNGVK